MDLEPFQVHDNNEGTSSKKKSICSEDQLENAVIKQELMAAKEEMADLKAKIYVSDKEKRGKKSKPFFFNFVHFLIFDNFFRVGFDFTRKKIS